MNLLRKIGLLTSAFLLASAGGIVSASTVTIDFDALKSTDLQTIPLPQFSEDGFTFQLSSTGNNSGPGIFNTVCGPGTGVNCNGDKDLIPLTGNGDVSGNVLILQEDGSAIPDDAATKGSITLTLMSGPAFHWLGFSMVDEQTIIGSVDGIFLGSGSPLRDSDTEKVVFDTPSRLIDVNDSITLHYAGSGGVDSLLLKPTMSLPLPPTFWLFGTGLVAVGAVVRRKNKMV